MEVDYQPSNRLPPLDNNICKSIVSGLSYDPRSLQRISLADVHEIMKTAKQPAEPDALVGRVAALSISPNPADSSSDCDIPMVTVSNFSEEVSSTTDESEKMDEPYVSRLMNNCNNKEYLKPNLSRFHLKVEHKRSEYSSSMKSGLRPSTFSTHFSRERRDFMKTSSTSVRSRFAGSLRHLKNRNFNRQQRLQSFIDYSPSLENSYRLAQTTLYWRSMPSKQSTTVLANCCHRDRLTVLYCSNFSGTKRLKPLVVGSTRDPRIIKNFEAFVVYKYNKYAQMTEQIISEWFFQYFVHHIAEFGSAILHQKTMLYFDSSVNTHPPLAQFASEQYLIQAMKLTTSLPVDYTTVGLARVEYKKRLLLDAVSCPNKFPKLGNAIATIRLAWDSVKPFDVEKCCNFIFALEENAMFPRWNSTEFLSSMQQELSSKVDINRLLRLLPGGKGLIATEIDSWIFEDQGIIIDKNPFF